MTKSGVMGLSPTVPRTPSVPKYLRVMGLPDRDHVLRFLYVMHAQYFGPALQRKQSHGEAAGEALLRRPPGELADRGFARQAGEQGDPEVLQHAQILQQREVVLGGLAEAEAGVRDDAPARDAGFLAFRDPLRKKG